MTTKPSVHESSADVRSALSVARGQGKSIAFVPTMGALHNGHLSLVDKAREVGDFVVVSIFVNPMQFATGEDLAKYPRELPRDIAMLNDRGVDLIFTPNAAAMYPDDFTTSVAVSGLTEQLCGVSRPGHFRGVTTVVAKLFNIIGPCFAVFGRKDYQQLTVIKRMVKDLGIPVEVIGVSTVREPDGLAMSSRNVYLSDLERKRALCIFSGLLAAHCLFEKGERNVGALRMAATEPIRTAADKMEYVSAANPDTLLPLSDSETVNEKLLIAAAIRIGSTRLIDNTVLGEDALHIIH